MINGDYLIARNTLLVTLFYTSDETFDLIRKRELFRYSRYVNKNCIVKSPVTELIEICQEYGTFHKNTFSYLYSIINYSTVLDSYNAFERHIIEEFETRLLISLRASSPPSSNSFLVTIERIPAVA